MLVVARRNAGLESGFAGCHPSRREILAV